VSTYSPHTCTICITSKTEKPVCTHLLPHPFLFGVSSPIVILETHIFFDTGREKIEARESWPLVAARQDAWHARASCCAQNPKHNFI